MGPKMSPAAEAIIEAGVSAAQGNGSLDLKASDRAVEAAVGKLGLNAPYDAGVYVSDALIEIAQAHVRHQVARRHQ